VLRLNEAPNIGAGLMEFYESFLNTFLYENEFQNPQIFHLPVSFSPKRSTLEDTAVCTAAVSLPVSSLIEN
jgi:hypothetical protein